MRPQGRRASVNPMIKTIVFEEAPSRDDLDRLREAVEEFNYATTGFRDGRYLVAFVRDDADAMIAGLSGFTWGGYAKVEFLWIAEPYRRAGLGRALLTAAEDEARARGCDQIVLDTHDFQAPGFYQKLGYERCGRTDGTPRGSGQTWFRKSLAG
jgi:ribosomal protein S18 acetylase RimI-like enzyme